LPTAKPRTERRAHARSTSRLLVMVCHAQDGDTVIEPARIWNLSAGGIALWMGHPIASGTELQLQFRRRKVKDRGASVLDANPEGEAWVVNCHLESPLSISELRALLT